jgi:hypothetical protein
MKKTNLIIISLCLSVFILASVVHADVISPGAAVKDALNLQLIILAVIIGIIAIIAGLVIRKIKKDSDSKKEPKIKA